MPKNFTKEELENGRWVTMKGTRVFIKDGETPQEAIDRALGKNTKKTEKKSYKDFDKKEDMAMELYKRTGINFRGDFHKVDKDTFAQTCETLEDLENKYHINGVSADDMQGDRLDVHVPTSYDHEFDGELEDAFAHARLGKITLNPECYSMNTQELDSVYAEGTEGYRPFHPKGTTAKDIIAHESAHHILDKQVWEMCEKDSDKYFKIQKFLTDKTEYDSMGENTLPEIKVLFNKFDKVRKNYISYLQKDEEAVKYLGSYLRDDTKLTFMANPEQFGRYGICKYAHTNYHELVAESFTDFYANGKDAKPLSKMICFEILDIKEAKL